MVDDNEGESPAGLGRPDSGNCISMGFVKSWFSGDRRHPDEVRMTLGEHLEELRSRLIRAIVAVGVGAAVCYAFIQYIVAFLTWPIYTTLRANGLPADIKIFNPAEQFMVELKVAVILGIIVSAPYSLVQIWGFVAAGLYPHERKWVRAFAPVSIALFFIGAAFLLVIVSPLLLSFLMTYRTELPNIERFMPTWMVAASNLPEIPAQPQTPEWPTTQPAIPCFTEDPANPPEGVLWINATEREVRLRIGETIQTLGLLQEAGHKNRIIPDMRINEVIPFVLQLAAAFGLGFQVPVVVAFLSVLGIVSAANMAKMRRYVVFGMAVAAAVITPPDPGSMTLLLVPMVFLFEAGLVAARMIERRRGQATS